MSYYNVMLLVLGFIFLLTGADFMVRGASSLAYKIKIPRILIGLVIIALGTSVPELAISIKSSMLHESGLIVGNILGSNITNIFLFFGIGGVIVPFMTKPNPYKKKNAIFLVIFSLIACGFLYTKTLDFYKGVILLFLFVAFITISYVNGKKYGIKYANDQTNDNTQNRNFFIIIILLLGGFVGILIGSELIVDGTINIAEEFKISDTFLGASIISVGTSLPEILVSIVALYKKEKSLALGNIIGSNVINILVALGVSAVINPIHVEGNMLVYYIVLVASSLFMLFVAVKPTKIGRIIGFICLIVYISFTIYNFR